ncbi:MAG: CoB--CoM heterodisulfide reductase iron-sulfur subunit A family protein, partial [Bacteroidales bacterium]|nr:CoB--CoM heterodisulfide reductase iron-sulfur subunit A family protein [Bacteroidales bacterium]
MEEKRIGVYVCWCGTNIAKMVDVEAVAAKIAKLPNVVIAKDYKYMCSDPGQDMIVQDIKEHKLNRVVVSACSPRIHELTFRKALENAGLNQYMFEMANIREQVSWVHDNREEATIKALDLIKGAVSKVSFNEALDKRSVDINPATLIVGGGVTGLSATLELADAGNKVYLVEKAGKLGGHVADIDLTFPGLSSAAEVLEPMIYKVNKHPEVEVFLNTTIDEIFGYVGNFESTIKSGGKEYEVKFGNVIVATGLTPFDPGKISSYNYEKLPDVITSLELEKMLKEGNVVKKDGSEPKKIAVIHCVGSRNTDYHEYCSRVCCLSALKFSNQLRSALPDANLFQIYADMRAFGKGCEELYTSTSRKDVMFLMYDQQEDLPRISKAEDGVGYEMSIEFYEKLSGEDIIVPADMVVLMVAMEAHEEAKEIAHAVGISLCGNEFYIERHPKLDPVATTTDGVYIAG